MYTLLSFFSLKYISFFSENKINNKNMNINDEDDFQCESRRSYLLTYSQANLSKYPNCLSFSELILEAFNEGKNKSTVKEWACCKEPHSDGNGMHYHMSLNLTGTRRWRPIRNSIYARYGISINFALKEVGYVAAYRYVTKEKPISEVLHSEGHTKMESIGSPRTKKAMKGNSQKRRSVFKSDTFQSKKKKSEHPNAKARRLSNSDVSEFIVKNHIRKEEELMTLALQRSQNGEKDLYNFIINKPTKALSELVSTTWKIQEAAKTLERERRSIMSIIQEHAAGQCASECEGEWLKCAKEVLRNNNVNLFHYASVVRQCFTKGRQKHNNILIVGPTNCGKSFLLNPIELMFKTFMNPATGRYALTGLDQCEVAYFNDFRWSPEIIAWSDFLLLLEGQTVHLPRPKNQYATDMCIERTNKIPIFATSKSEIEYQGKFNSRDDCETDMMASRWQVFRFHHKIPENEIKDVPPCTYCFGKLILLGSEFDN